MDESQTRTELAHTEFLAYGTTRLFDKRMRSLDWKRKVVTFLGVFVPLMIGGVVLSFGLESYILQALIAMAGVATILQLAFSLWSLVAAWDRSYSDCMASVKENTAIYNQAVSIKKKIGQIDGFHLKSLVEDLNDRYQRREQEDLALGVSDKEMRYATRMACFYFKKNCHVCNKTPIALKPGKCDGCGNF